MNKELKTLKNIKRCPCCDAIYGNKCVDYKKLKTEVMRHKADDFQEFFKWLKTQDYDQEEIDEMSQETILALFCDYFFNIGEDLEEKKNEK
ncbi:MAG: hypothetical protein ACOC5T_01615 [Elusimicrobiota bacterium]